MKNYFIDILTEIIIALNIIEYCSQYKEGKGVNVCLIIYEIRGALWIVKKQFWKI